VNSEVKWTKPEQLFNISSVLRPPLRVVQTSGPVAVSWLVTERNRKQTLTLVKVHNAHSSYHAGRAHAQAADWLVHSVDARGAAHPYHEKWWLSSGSTESNAWNFRCDEAVLRLSPEFPKIFFGNFLHVFCSSNDKGQWFAHALFKPEKLSIRTPGKMMVKLGAIFPQNQRLSQLGVAPIYGISGLARPQFIVFFGVFLTK
jgi:hypothetical protein